MPPPSLGAAPAGVAGPIRTTGAGPVPRRRRRRRSAEFSGSQTTRSGMSVTCSGMRRLRPVRSTASDVAVLDARPRPPWRPTAARCGVPGARRVRSSPCCEPRPGRAAAGARPVPPGPRRAAVAAAHSRCCSGSRPRGPSQVTSRSISGARACARRAGPSVHVHGVGQHLQDAGVGGSETARHLVGLERGLEEAHPALPVEEGAGLLGDRRRRAAPRRRAR